MSRDLADSKSHNSKRSLLLSFKEKESSFLKKRSKRLLLSRADFAVRFRSEACFQVVRLIGGGFLPYRLAAATAREDTSP